MLTMLAIAVGALSPSKPLVGDEGLALAGREPMASFPLGVFAAPGVAGEVELELQLSGLVDPARSSLAVLLDGVPVKAASLAALRPVDDRIRWKVSLPVVAKGFHQLTLRAQLEVYGGCEALTGRETWLTVLTGSRWLRANDVVVERSVRDAVRQLQESRPLQVEWDSPAGVQPTPEWVVGYLALDHWLRTLGLEPRVRGAWSRESGETGPVFHVSVAAPGKAKCDQGLTIVEAEPNGIRFTVEDPLQLALVARALSAGAADRCPQRRCEFPSLSARTEPKIDDEAVVDPIEVSSLRRLGFAQGWTARGEGVHELRFAIDRRPGWIIERAPRLELEVSRSQGEHVDSRQSILEVQVNGRPLGSFSLQQFQKESLASVELPPSLWRATQWNVLVRVLLRAPPGRPCTERTGAFQWLTVGATTRLLVWRREPTYHGLAAVAEKFTINPPKLALRQIPSWVGIEALAGVLFALLKDRPRLWELEVDYLNCNNCIVVTTATQMDTPLALWRGVDGSVAWRDMTGASSLPLVVADPGVWISTELEVPQRLTVHLSPSAKKSGVSSPDYQSLSGPVAVYADDRWVSAGPAAKPLQWVTVALQSEGASLAPVLSKEKAARVFVSRVWLLGALPVLAGLVWWAFRAYRLKRQVGVH